VHPPKDVLLDAQFALQCGVSIVTFSSPMPAGLTCHYCELPATTRDHIVTDSLGGAKAWWNLVPACRDCNGSRGNGALMCACPWCIRAVALFYAGFRRSGRSQQDRPSKKGYRRRHMAKKRRVGQ